MDNNIYPYTFKKKQRSDGASQEEMTFEEGNSPLAEDGTPELSREIIVVGRTWCGSRNGGPWECDDDCCVTSTPFDEWKRIVSGQPASGAVLTSYGTELDERNGKECRLFYLEETFQGGGGNEFLWYRELCFDTNTYLPVSTVAVYHTIENGETIPKTRTEQIFTEFNMPLEIDLPES